MLIYDEYILNIQNIPESIGGTGGLFLYKHVLVLFLLVCAYVWLWAVNNLLQGSFNCFIKLLAYSADI